MKIVKALAVVVVVFFAFIGVKSLGTNFFNKNIVSNTKDLVFNMKSDAVTNAAIDNIEQNNTLGEKTNGYDICIYDSKTGKNNTFTLNINKNSAPQELVNVYRELFCENQRYDFEDFPKIDVSVVDGTYYLNFERAVDFLDETAERMFIENITNVLCYNYDVNELYVRNCGGDYVSRNFTIGRDKDVILNYTNGVKKEKGLVTKTYEAITGANEKSYDLDTYVYDIETGEDVEVQTAACDGINSPENVGATYVKTYIATSGYTGSADDFPEITIDCVKEQAHINFDGDLGFLGSKEELHFIQNLINTLVVNFSVKEAYVYENGKDYESPYYTFDCMYNIINGFSKNGMEEAKKEREKVLEKLQSESFVTRTFSDNNCKLYFYNSKTKENEMEKVKVSSDITPNELLDSYIELYLSKSRIEVLKKYIPNVDVIMKGDTFYFNFEEPINTLTPDEEKMFLQNIINAMVENFGAYHIYIRVNDNDYVSNNYRFEKDFDISSKYSVKAIKEAKEAK